MNPTEDLVETEPIEEEPLPEAKRRPWAVAVLLALVVAGVMSVFVPAAGALPSKHPATGATCIYTWADPGGGATGLYVSGISQGTACTAQVTLYCDTGGGSGYWTSWVTLNIPQPVNSQDGRNTNPCGAPSQRAHIYYRELFPFGRRCWTDLWNAGTGWQWNVADGFCNQP